MKSFHIILKDHKLGESLGAKNIKIAQSFGLDAQVHTGVLGENSKRFFKKYKINRFLHQGIKRVGQKGCFLSHFQLWQKCLELNETIIICEHDGVFLRNLPSNILDFKHILRLESFEHWKDNYEEKVTSSVDKEIKILTLPTEFKTHYVGYYGYAIKPEGAKLLIQQAQDVGIMPVDQFVDNRIVDIKSVSSSVVRLDKIYIGNTTKLSTTYNYKNSKR